MYYTKKRNITGFFIINFYILLELLNFLPEFYHFFIALSILYKNHKIYNYVSLIFIVLYVTYIDFLNMIKKLGVYICMQILITI